MIAYGLNLNYDFSPRFGVMLAVDKIDNIDKGKMDIDHLMFTLNLVYHINAGAYA